jgi:hypothetical protein
MENAVFDRRPVQRDRTVGHRVLIAAVIAKPIVCEIAKSGVFTLAEKKSASIMRDNLPGESMKNDAFFVRHTRQNRQPFGGQLPLFPLLHEPSFKAPR